MTDIDESYTKDLTPKGTQKKSAGAGPDTNQHSSVVLITDQGGFTVQKSPPTQKNELSLMEEPYGEHNM